MNIATLAFLSLGMSMDAFAGAMTRGSRTATPQKSVVAALKVGLVFGVVEMITPVIGYFLGVMAEGWISSYDHWLSFVLLGGLGLHLIYGAVVHKDSQKTPKANNGIPFKTLATVFQSSNNLKSPLILTAFTAVATSVDAMIVGVGLAFVNVNIWLASLMIGTATTVMASLGDLGARLGETIGNYAEIVGGAVLIGVGVFILLSHLGVI